MSRAIMAWRMLERVLFLLATQAHQLYDNMTDLPKVRMRLRPSTMVQIYL